MLQERRGVVYHKQMCEVREGEKMITRVVCYVDVVRCVCMLGESPQHLATALQPGDFSSVHVCLAPGTVPEREILDLSMNLRERKSKNY